MIYNVKIVSNDVFSNWKITKTEMKVMWSLI